MHLYWCTSTGWQNDAIFWQYFFLFFCFRPENHLQKRHFRKFTNSQKDMNTKWTPSHLNICVAANKIRDRAHSRSLIEVLNSGLKYMVEKEKMLMKQKIEIQWTCNRVSIINFYLVRYAVFVCSACFFLMIECLFVCVCVLHYYICMVCLHRPFFILFQFKY